MIRAVPADARRGNGSQSVPTTAASDRHEPKRPEAPRERPIRIDGRHLDEQRPRPLERVPTRELPP